ncbi:MAG: hypothetical protein ACYDEP_03585 [Acidimicrobiales bacterium]
MELQFAQAARRPRAGTVLAGRRCVGCSPAPALLPRQRRTAARRGCGVGLDDRGRELEVIAVEVQGPQDLDPVLLVIHVIPTHFKKEES